MNKLICTLLLFFNTSVFSYSQLYESDLYYLDKNEVLFYKILNWWSTIAHENSTDFCFNDLRVRSNKTLDFNYDKKTKILKISTKEKFADLVSVFENKNRYLQNEYINKNYFKNLKKENINNISIISLKNVSLNEYQKLNKLKKNIAFELEGKILGLLAYSGKASFYSNAEFLRFCPKNKEAFNVSFKLLNIKTKEILIKYFSKNK
ncbi:hypothetical protein CRV00_01725 [Malaciobacter molluscorum]|uniref:hypothetical protein n=1 Tax=Malaciobacter molluscorum TaxID=1032072 RepID=UPI00100A7349|nr:hypothetical protein [Malaciobacter molluscorum]RXJ96363.1 hypothetical protein CRV00_01725 [Malaciobacter molluscorum]